MDADLFLMRVSPLLSLQQIRALRCVNSRWQQIVDDCLDPSLNSVISPFAQTLGTIEDLSKIRFGLDINYDIGNRTFELKFHSCGVCLSSNTPCPDERNAAIILELDKVTSSGSMLEKRQSVLRVFLALHLIISRVFSLEPPKTSSRYSLNVYTNTFRLGLESQTCIDEQGVISGNGSLLLLLLRRFCCFLYEREDSYEAAYVIIKQVPTIAIRKQLLLDLVVLCITHKKWDLVWSAGLDLGQGDQVLSDYFGQCQRYYNIILTSPDDLRNENVSGLFSQMEGVTANNTDYPQSSSDLHMLVSSLNGELKRLILDKMKFLTDLSQENFNFIYGLFPNNQDFWNFITTYLKDHPFSTDIQCGKFLLRFLHRNINSTDVPLLKKVICTIGSEQVKFAGLSTQEKELPSQIINFAYENSRDVDSSSITKSVQNILQNTDEEIGVFKSFYIKCFNPSKTQFYYERDFLQAMIVAINDNTRYSLEQKTSFFLDIYKVIASQSLLKAIRWLSKIPNLQCQLPKLLWLAVSFFRLIGWLFKS